jgi:Lon protease-like protein
MIHKLEIPAEVPVMTLSSAVLFPQAMMPLFIFEPRYKKMLVDVLETDRIFAVAALDETNETTLEQETPHSIAGIGMIRACRKHSDGSANLVIQGLARVEFECITAESPYRTARIHQIVSEIGGAEDTLTTIQPKLIGLIQTQIRLGADIPKEVISFLHNVREPENALDLAIYTLCSSTSIKQELLETRGILPRFEKFQRFLRQEIERLKIERTLRGDLDGGNISNN